MAPSGTAFAYAEGPAVDPRGEAAAFCDSTGGWLPLVCTLGCTVATEWVARPVRPRPRRHRAGAGRYRARRRPLFLPHLAGERTPSLPKAAGLFAGLRASHGPDALVRAVMEGVTFGLGYGLDVLRRTGVEPTAITLVGGGAASDGWGQFCADVFELPVQRPAVSEAAALGAALQARWVVDGVEPPAARLDATWEPRPSDALRAARDRTAELRQLAAEHAL